MAEKLSTTKALIKVIVYYSGFLFLWKLIANKGRPLIIYYHEIFDKSDDVGWCHEHSLLIPYKLFRSQLKYLSKHYEFVSLEEAVRSKSSKAIAITFDDGYRGVYSRAFPVLKEMKIPATIFLITDYLNSGELPWWDGLAVQLEEFMSRSYEERMQISRGLPTKWQSLLMGDSSIGVIVESYKIASSDERQRLKEVLEKGVGPPRRNGERVFVSEEEIQEMQAAGISFGSHTKSHPILTWLDSKSLLEELHDSKNAIEKVTGSNRMWFSYPDGMFSDKEERAVQEVGYIGAVQTFRNPERSSMFAVPRVGLSVVSTTGFKGRFSRAKMEVTLAGINRKRIKMLRKSFRF